LKEVSGLESETFLILLGGLLVLAFLAEEAFRRLRLPPVLVLMACGLILGPATGLLPAERFSAVAPHFGALAFLLILFEGGLDLNLTAVVSRLRAGLALAAIGFGAAALAAGALATAAGLAPDQAVVLAVVVAPISGAIVLPLASRLGLREEVRTLVVLEAALADVLGVLAMTLLKQLHAGGGWAGLVALGSLMAALFSILLAVAAGLLWPRVLRRLGDRRFVDVLTFGGALAMWGFVEMLGASGALAVLVLGVTLANEREFLDAVGAQVEPVASVTGDAVKRLHLFTAQLTFLVRTFFFVFLGVVIEFGSLRLSRALLAMGFVALFVCVRRLVIDGLEASGAFALSEQEKRTVWLMQPRGLVSAVLAIEASHLGVDDGSFLGVVFLVILATNVLLVLVAGGRQGEVTAAVPAAAGPEQPPFRPSPRAAPG
jgi:cell volume regulation protein A